MTSSLHGSRSPRLSLADSAPRHANHGPRITFPAESLNAAPSRSSHE